jgi:type IV pilus assembly protein PilY1
MKHQSEAHPVPRARSLRGLVGAGLLLASCFAPALAHAQADVSPPPPNVLLLVDSSGSMDYKTNGNTFPACRYNGSTTTAATSERSRWIELVEVLTGSINNYECQRLDRNSAAFRNEYALGGNPPYDFLYANPYNRPVSNGCVVGPGTLDATNKALFPTGALKSHPFDNTLGTCDFSQATDGVLDAFASDIRFGLMTFDSEPRPGKDVSGLWSYYVSSSRQGEPLGCTEPQDQEVGVRNPEAPPWEGRAVGFGNPGLGSTDYTTRNAMIQQVLLATRPYGATPIAGMLDDARNYFTADASDDPLNASFKFGPSADPAKDCRYKSIVLLSDGQPNMDLRPFCEPGGCPYDKAEDIAQDLKSKGIEIYVIGFALPVVINGVPKSCASIDRSEFEPTNPNNICKNATDQAVLACCALNRIAAAGGHVSSSPDDPDWTRAHFADDRETLRRELSIAIGGNIPPTTRTPIVPATSSGFISQTSDLAFARSFRFSASFKPAKLDKPWIGELNRGRYVCENNVPVLLEVDGAKGDRFVDNVNYSGPDARKIYTVIGTSPVKSDASMRPNLTVDVLDGIGAYTGVMNPTALSSASFVSSTPAEAIRVTDTTCDSPAANLNAAECRDRYLKWLVGVNNNTIHHRCPSPGANGSCNLISEIYHSIPRAVEGRPSQFLLDQSYQGFVTAQVTKKRPSVLYASSNDGFLHAFKIAQVDKGDASEAMQVKTKETNELWTFVPPAVLPRIPSQYPGTHQLLLDGTPAIKEVVASEETSLPGTYKFKLERTSAQARGGLGTWRTILVQSYGKQHPGYFAIDVTDPVPSSTGGPKFLWQLVTDAAGNQLFGDGGGTPLITTVFLDHKEVAVAVLPGGYSHASGTDAAGSPGTGCNRGKDWSSTITPRPRAAVPCYADIPAAVRARSITVVRLDSGEILRSFRQNEAEVPGLAGKNVVTQAFIDSPMTGQPVAYPNDVGGVADRVFIGDQDGGLWRLNFASATGKTSDWAVDLFFDAFPSDGTGEFSHKWNHGQPVISMPVISVDRKGSLTIAFSTGEQEAIGADPTKPANYVWSLTEELSADRKTLTPKVNWYLALKDGLFAGDRVIGEMALFSGDLFFSTVGPGTSNDVCNSGSGKIWGMHYLEPGAAKGAGGRTSNTLAKLVTAEGYVDATTLLGSNARAFLSGVSVAQQPTCDSPGTAADNGYFAYGSKPTGGAAAPGKYQLIIPTGDRASTSTKPGISNVKLGGGNAVAIDLQQPVTPLIVDSWASIVE